MDQTKKEKRNKDVLEDSMDEILSWGSPLSRGSDRINSEKGSPSSTTLDFLDDEPNFRITEADLAKQVDKMNISEHSNDKKNKKKSIFESSESLESLESSNIKTTNNNISNENSKAINHNEEHDKKKSLSIWDDEDDDSLFENNSQDVEEVAEIANEPLADKVYECDDEDLKKVNETDNNVFNNEDVESSNEFNLENSINETNDNETNAFEVNADLENSINELNDNEANVFDENTDLEKPNETDSNGFNNEANAFDEIIDNETNGSSNELNLENSKNILNDNETNELNEKVDLENSKSRSNENIFENDFEESDEDFFGRSEELNLKEDKSVSTSIDQEDLDLLSNANLNEKVDTELLTSELDEDKTVSISSEIDVNSHKIKNSVLMAPESYETQNSDDISHKFTPSMELDEFSTEGNFNQNFDNEFSTRSEEAKSFCTEEFELKPKEIINSNLTENSSINQPASSITQELFSSSEDDDPFNINFKQESLNTKFKNDSMEDILEASVDQTNKIAKDELKTVEPRVGDNSIKSDKILKSEQIDKSTIKELSDKPVPNGLIKNKMPELLSKSTSMSSPMKKPISSKVISSKPSTTSKFLNPLALKYIGNELFVCIRKHVKRSINGNIIDLTINSTSFLTPKIPEISENSFKDKRVFEAINLPLRNIISDYPAVKSLLFLRDDLIFTKDVVITLNSNVLNDCCTQGELLINKPSELLKSIDQESSSNKLQHEVLKMKLGLPCSFEGIEMSANLFNQIALTGDQSLIKSFIKSQENRILFFILFYKLNLVRFESYRHLFENNIYFQFVLSKASLIEYSQKSKSKWNINSVINLGISKILNVNKPEQSNAQSPLELAFSGTKQIISEPAPTENKNLTEVPDKSKIVSSLNEKSLFAESLSTDSSLSEISSNFSSISSNFSSLSMDSKISSSFTEKLKKSRIAVSNKPYLLKKQEPSSVDKEASIIENKIADLSVNDKKLEIPTDLKIEEPKIVKRNSIFEESNDDDLFGIEDSNSSPSIKKLSPMLESKSYTSPVIDSTKPVIDSTSPDIKSHQSPDVKSHQSPDIKPLSPVQPIAKPLGSSNFKFTPPTNRNFKNLDLKTPPINVTKAQNLLNESEQKTPESVYKNPSNVKSASDLLEDNVYKKKFSKSFADIFSLDGQTEVSETPDLSSCFAEITETDKPILDVKETVSSGFFGFFRRKPAVVAQPKEDPLLDRATRPLKAELKMPQNKERKVVQSPYANMKGAASVDIPGFNSTKK